MFPVDSFVWTAANYANVGLWIGLFRAIQVVAKSFSFRNINWKVSNSISGVRV
jgi:hypothetical protein